MKNLLLPWLLVFSLLSEIGFGVPTYNFKKTNNDNVIYDLKLEAKSAVLMEPNTGTIIYEKNPDERLKPASVTKVMTLLLIFEEIDSGRINYDDIVTVSEHAASMGGSQCFFEQGEQQTVKDMIKCIEIASGNDAAVAMAEHISGSEEAFVAKMNNRAKELGMENTHFVNACGLDADEHYTSARDIAIMSRELTVKHPAIFEYSTIWMDYIIHKTKRGESRFDLANTNKFLRSYTGATGLKTGYTGSALYCMSATASRDDINLIAVIMGAPTKEIRNSEAGKLLDYGFSLCNKYQDTDVLPGDLKIPVRQGNKKYVDYMPIENVCFSVIDVNPQEIKKEIIIFDNLKAPVLQGDIVGSIQYSYKDKLIYCIDIIASEKINKITYKSCILSIFDRLFMVNH